MVDGSGEGLGIVWRINNQKGDTREGTYRRVGNHLLQQKSGVDRTGGGKPKGKGRKNSVWAVEAEAETKKGLNE